MYLLKFRIEPNRPFCMNCPKGVQIKVIVLGRKARPFMVLTKH